MIEIMSVSPITGASVRIQSTVWKAVVGDSQGLVTALRLYANLCYICICV